MASRFYIPPAAWSEKTLPDEEVSHALRVLRIREGEQIEFFNGEGKVAHAVVEEISKKSFTFKVEEEWETRPISPEVHLYQAVPKGKNMELIIQKAVELGVSEIHPIITQNTIAISDQPDKKRDKWQKTALEACKQCKQAFLPIVHLPVNLKDLPAFSEDLKVIGALTEEAVSLKEILEKEDVPEKVALAIGPEGDFTSEELTFFQTQGFLPATLGSLTLRAETAALFMLSSVNYAFKLS